MRNIILGILIGFITAFLFLFFFLYITDKKEDIRYLKESSNGYIFVKSDFTKFPLTIDKVKYPEYISIYNYVFEKNKWVRLKNKGEFKFKLEYKTKDNLYDDVNVLINYKVEDVDEASSKGFGNFILLKRQLGDTSSLSINIMDTLIPIDYKLVEYHVSERIKGKLLKFTHRQIKNREFKLNPYYKINGTLIEIEFDVETDDLIFKEKSKDYTKEFENFVGETYSKIKELF